MIEQLAQLIQATDGGSADDARRRILAADPMDIAVRIEQTWDHWSNPSALPSVRLRRSLWEMGAFSGYPQPALPYAPWDHAGYALIVENTRAVQILRRVVREYRAGEALGIPSEETQRWLDATEAILFGAGNLFGPWLATSAVRPDPEAVRRNLYERLFDIKLAFGDHDDKLFQHDHAAAVNRSFVPLFEELLVEVWQAIVNIKNIAGVNSQDDDRIFRLAEELGYMLRSRRQERLLAREELVASTALGWVVLTLSTNTPVVEDLRAQATSPADRLKLIGERVGLRAHGHSAAFLSMPNELSLLLRTIESGAINGPADAAILYREETGHLGAQSRRVITEWAAATGRNLKARPGEGARPAQRQLAPR